MWALTSPCTTTISDLFCIPFVSAPQQSSVLSYIKVCLDSHWFHKLVSQLMKYCVSYSPMSYRICEANSPFFSHLSQVGFLDNLDLKKCPFRWQCSVNSSVTHCNYFLFGFNSYLVLLVEGPCKKTLCMFESVKDYWYFLWSLSIPWQPSWQYLVKHHMLVQVLWKEVQIQILPVDQPHHYPQYLCKPAPISVELRYIQPVSDQFLVNVVIMKFFNRSLTFW
jgi:hypothetical protein